MKENKMFGFGQEDKKTSVGGSEKLTALMEGLGKLEARSTQASAQPAADATVPFEGAQTIADDVALPLDVQHKIKQQEGLVREALTLVGVDYDALILMDGKSCYARAVAARPEILGEIVKSEAPVLAALKVATQFKPYAEFMTKYGESPESIKEAIRAEVLNENKQKHASVEREEGSPAKAAAVVPFSYGGRSVKEKGREAKSSLKDIFGQ